MDGATIAEGETPATDAPAEDPDKKLLEAAEKLPLADRVAHKSWKARKAAYEFMLGGAGEPDNSTEFLDLAPGIVSDANQIAQDAACDVVLKLLEVCPSSALSGAGPRLASALTKKALTARPVTLKKVSELLFKLVEHGFADDVVASCSAQFTHKTPKVALAALDIVLQALQQFGNRVVTGKSLAPALVPVFDAKDVKVRGKCKEIVLELAKWAGTDAVRTALIAKMRDTQKAEMEKWFQADPPERPTPVRFTYEDRAKGLHLAAAAAPAAPPADAPADNGAAKPVSSASNNSKKAPGAAVAAPSPPADLGGPQDEELFPPVDVISQIPKSFWSDVADAKWSVRRQALASLTALCAVPAAEASNWFDVAAVLKKVLQKDSNAACVAEAAAAVAAIARALRTGFANFAKSTFFPLCVDKLKDKNSAVQSKSLDAVGAMYRWCVKLVDVSEVLTSGMSSPSPKAKQLLLTWLAGAVASEKVEGESKKAAAGMMPGVVACAADGSPDVRDAAVAAIASLAGKIGGLGAIEKHLAKLDGRRRQQIEAAVAGASDSAGGSPGDVAPPDDGGRKAAPAAAAPKRPTTAGAAGRSRPGAVPKSASQSRPATQATKSAAKSGKESANAVSDSSPAVTLSKEEAVEALGEAYGAACAKQLTSSVWKDRLAGMETALEADRTAVDFAAVGSRLTAALCMIPGWKDTNFQVLSKLCAACSMLADQTTSFSRGDTNLVVTGVVDKLADSKIKPHAFELLMMLAEVSSLKFVMARLWSPASSHKNPKVLQAALVWATSAINTFGIQAVDVATLISAWLKVSFAHANAAVRSAAIDLSVVARAALGPGLEAQLEADVKPAVMGNVRDAWGKGLPEMAAPSRRERKAKKSATTRGGAGGKRAEDAGGGGAVSAAANGAEANQVDDEEEEAGGAAMDLLPRVDISEAITPALLSQLAASDWKERKAALDSIERLVAEAGGRITSSLGGLLSAVKQRFADSNRNLAAQAIRVSALLASAVGPAFESISRSLLGALLKNSGDNKPVVRAAVVEFIAAFVAAAGWAALGDAPATALTGPKAASVGKCTVMEGFRACLAAGCQPRSADDFAAVVPAVAVALEDKGIEGRKLAMAVLTGITTAENANRVYAAATSLSAVQRSLVLEQLDKAGFSAAAAPPPAAASTRAPTAGGARGNGQSGRPTSGGPGSRSGRMGARKGAATPASAAAAADAGASGASRLASTVPTGGRGAGGGAAADADDCPLLAMAAPGDKDERRLPQRSMRFEPRVGEDKDVKAALTPFLRPSLAALMFASDFKQHCKACDLLLANLEEYEQAFTSLLDLFLRWAVLRFMDEKLQSILKVQQLLEALLKRLHEDGYMATDNEANVFVPCLCDKVGHNQAHARSGYVKLLSRFRSIYNTHRFIVFLQEGMDSKNMRSRADCCDQVAAIVRDHGIAVLYRGPRSKRTSGVLKRLAALTTERDSQLRNASLAALMAVYEQQGRQLWALLGDLPAAQRDLVHERAKVVEKQMIKNGKQPGQMTPAIPDVTPPASPRATVTDAGREDGSGAHWEPPRPSENAQAMANGGHPQALQPAQPPVAASTSDSAMFGDTYNSAALVADSPRASTDLFGAGMNGHAVSGEAMAHSAALSASSDVVSQENAALAARVLGAGHTPQPGVLPSPNAGVAQAAPPEGYRLRYLNALADMRDNPEDTCIESIKSVFFTLTAMSEGGAAACPLSVEEQELISDSVNELALMLISRSLILTNLATTLALAADPNPLRGLRYMMNCIWKIYDLGLGAQMDTPTTSRVVGEVLAQLTHHRTFQLTFKEGGQELMRVMNIIMCKLLEKTPNNTVFAALINCLLVIPDIVQTRGPTHLHCYKELAVKCLIKLTKQIRNLEVDIADLLLNMHHFFSALGAEQVRRLVNAGDKPVRMVKTVLHELCKAKGLVVLETARALPAFQELPSKPLVMLYIEINFRSLAEMGLADQEAVAAALTVR